MSDITQFSQATVSQALTQLSQSASASSVTRQGVDVLVKHLAGNVLSLGKSTVLLNKVVLLNNPQIKGNLTEGQVHQIKLSIGNDPSLDFFTPASVKSTQVIPLTEQQLQSLLRLPAKQFILNNPRANTDLTNKLPPINATIISLLPKAPSSTQALKNNGVTHQQNILRVNLTDLRPPIEVALPLKPLNRFAAGEKITLVITPKGNNWQLTILSNKTAVSNLSKNVVDDRALLKNQLVTSGLPAPEIKIVKDQQSIISPILASPLLKASLHQVNTAKPLNFDLPVKLILQQLSKSNHQQIQDLKQRLQSLPKDKITLQIKPNGDINLLLHNTKPVANIPLTKEIAQALVPLKLPNQQEVIKQLNLPKDSNKPLQTISQAPAADLNLNIKTLGSERLHHSTTDNKLWPVVPPVDGSKYAEFRLNMEQARANLLAKVQQNPVIQSVISPGILVNKPQQTNLVQSLLRIVQAKAEAPAITLQSIEKALVDVEFFKGATEHSSKQLIEQVLHQIKQALPQGKEQDANQIRQLLTTPALHLSALQMITPSSNQGFMSGLVTLLQMSLSARLARNQSGRAAHITETLNNVLGAVSKVKSSVTPRAMVDLLQLDQKHQLIKEIGRLLSGHQTSKLANAEQMIQGQETFYYNLPSALGGNLKDVELLIKREENDKENASTQDQNNKTWQLTMKLAVGELGELLTKAKLRSDTLEINFYASNEDVKIQVMNYLPLLRRKFDSLGIEVSKSQCQLGKIPDTLQQRPYHMFQAKA
jgi:hypothetical protein